jgi:hypothetical protein
VERSEDVLLYVLGEVLPRNGLHHIYGQSDCVIGVDDPFAWRQDPAWQVSGQVRAQKHEVFLFRGESAEEVVVESGAVGEEGIESDRASNVAGTWNRRR